MGFNDTDARKALPNDFGKIGERRLNGLIASVHFFAEKTGADNNQRHGNEYKGSQGNIDITIGSALDIFGGNYPTMK